MDVINSFCRESEEIEVLYYHAWMKIGGHFRFIGCCKTSPGQKPLPMLYFLSFFFSR